MKHISVKGTIVANDDAWIYDYFEIENTCPRAVAKALEEADGDEITIEINSGGGDVFAGNEIYYLLDQYEPNTVVDIVGLAASAATIIACAGDKVRAVPGAQYMIHNVSSMAAGDYNEMDKMSEILQNANKSISNIYRMKTGMTNKKLLELMNDETWMDTEKAMKYGFIDEVIGDEGKPENNGGPFTINNGIANVLSDEVKAKIRATVKNPDANGTSGADEKLLHAQARLKLVKLKGEIN